MSLSSILYDVARIAGKAGSVSNDIKNISEGNIDKVAKKAVKRELHKSLNKLIRF